jgi:hypothetical protein
MKKNLKNMMVLIGTCIAFLSCSTASINLDELTLKEDVTDLTKGRQKSVDTLEMLTALPGY